MKSISHVLFSLQFGFRPQDTAQNVIPQIELYDLTYVEHHESLAVAQSDIHRILAVVTVIERID